MGFHHEPPPEMIAAYRTGPLERRAAWLMAGFRAWMLQLKKVRGLQDRFRSGER